LNIFYKISSDFIIRIWIIDTNKRDKNKSYTGIKLNFKKQKRVKSNQH